MIYFEIKRIIVNPKTFTPPLSVGYVIFTGVVFLHPLNDVLSILILENDDNT